MTKARGAGAVLAVLTIYGCSEDRGPATQPTADPLQSMAWVHQASGGYHFLIPADFNGGIFGGAVDNLVTFHASRDAEGNVSGRWTYQQTFAGITYNLQGSVTCLHVYDTPVLERFPSIPAMTANRAKWGGPIERTNDPTVPVGTFAWFQSIDNGEGTHSPPDLSTIAGLGDEAANEAFCNSNRVPNPAFGPHPVQGNIQVR
jgi:hypothetical protein